MADTATVQTRDTAEEVPLLAVDMPPQATGKAMELVPLILHQHLQTVGMDRNMVLTEALLILIRYDHRRHVGEFWFCWNRARESFRDRFLSCFAYVIPRTIST
jgi:hypothetical protein